MKVSARNDFSLIGKNDLVDIKLRNFYWWKSVVNNKQSYMHKHVRQGVSFPHASTSKIRRVS